MPLAHLEWLNISECCQSFEVITDPAFGVKIVSLLENNSLARKMLWRPKSFLRVGRASFRARPMFNSGGEEFHVR